MTAPTDGLREAIGVSGEITFEVCGALFGGNIGIRRDGRVVDHGRIDDLRRKYRPGDVVLVSPGMWSALRGKVRPAEGRAA